MHLNVHFTLILFVRPNGKFYNFNGIKTGSNYEKNLK